MADEPTRAQRTVGAVATAAKALSALLGGSVIAAVAGKGTLAVVLLVVGAASAAVAVLADARAKALERDAIQRRARADAARLESDRERERLALLSTTTWGVREHVPRLAELTAYDLGADHEAMDLQDDGQVGEPRAPYLPRDRDRDVRDALAAARRQSAPSVVVLRGPSKAGKSRTLFEAVSNDVELGGAAVIVPRDAQALDRLLEPGGLPATDVPEMVLWLDDLERFVTASGHGLTPDALNGLATWARLVVVVATAGGRGADQLAATQLSVPIDRLYTHPRVRIVALTSDLSGDERTRVRERFGEDVAAQIEAHGIGEYLVAAAELARKLEEERHRPGDPACPEGAAVAWAAIDWARTGMTTAISERMLRELWRHYLRGRDATDERFTHGRDWALEPVHRSIALLARTTSFEPYDWIVMHVDQHLRTEIKPAVWDHIFDAADADTAFNIGAAAFARGSWARSARALTRAEESTDAYLAAAAAFNMGLVRTAQQELADARDAYQHAIDSGHAEIVPFAALNLGRLLEDQGEPEGARNAYQQVIDSEHPDQAPMAKLNLGNLLGAQGELEAACDAYQQAIDSGHADVAPEAAFNLALLLEAQGDPQRARNAYRLAIDSGHADVAPTAWRNLGVFLADQGELDGARTAYQMAIDSAHPDQAPTAAVNLGNLLSGTGETDGARDAYQLAIDSGHVAMAPKAARNLGRLLSEAGELDGARDAYQLAIDSGDVDQTPKATFNLASLLEAQEEFDEARDAYQLAIDSGHVDVAPAAAVALGGLLSDVGDAKGARDAYQRAIDFSDPDVSPMAAVGLGVLLTEQGDAEGARRAFELAMDSGHPEAASLASEVLNPPPD